MKVLLVLLIAVFSVCSNSICSHIPIEKLFANSERSYVKLSPDGAMISSIRSIDGVKNLWVRDLKTSQEFQVTFEEKYGIYKYFWAYDNQHLIVYKDHLGNENWNLFKVDLNTKQCTPLLLDSGAQVRALRCLSCPHELIVLLNKRLKSCHDAYKLNITSGELCLLEKNPGNVIDWYINEKMQICGKVVALNGGGSQVWARLSPDHDWQLVDTWDKSQNCRKWHEDPFYNRPVYICSENQRLYLLDSSRLNTLSLVEVDLSTAKRTTLFHDEVADIKQSFFDSYTFKPLFCSYVREKLRYHFFDCNMQSDFDYVRSKLQGKGNIYSRDVHNKKWLINAFSSTDPGSFWLFNRQTKELKHLFDIRPNLNKYKFSKVQPISFNARDGMKIYGFVTYPRSNHKKLPLVVQVHGGPWSRDYDGFYPHIQFLADRGYAVLQVNFRGSGGYGKAYLDAGDKQWAQKMHTDLIDGVNYLAKEGKIDLSRVCIKGGSFGGYAALVGASMTPDFFKCAIDFCGPCNLFTCFSSFPRYWDLFKWVWAKRGACIETEKELAQACSPIFYTDNIKIPLLVIHGANDVRVLQAESEAIVQSLKERKIPCEYLLFEDEGHGIRGQENRFEYCRAIEGFLQKYL